MYLFFLKQAVCNLEAKNIPNTISLKKKPACIYYIHFFNISCCDLSFLAIVTATMDGLGRLQISIIIFLFLQNNSNPDLGEYQFSCLATDSQSGWTLTEPFRHALIQIRGERSNYFNFVYHQ